MNDRVLVMAALLAVVAAQPGCVQVPVPPPPGIEPRPAPTEPADPARRAALRLELASLYFSRGQADTALEEVNRAIQAKPDLGAAHSLKGLINASQNDIAAAETSFKRALQLAPNDADTMHNFGWVLCQQRRYDEADALFAQAVAQPTYREQVRTLLAQGVCQARAGRWADAERTLSRSYEIDPSNPVTAYNLSDVLLQRGELERARFYVSRINGIDELTTAQSLWLAVRIDRRMGNLKSMQDTGRRLRDRFPQSSEALRFERGRFDE